MLRVAVDANVWISALLHGRGTRPILDAFIVHRFRLITSDTLIEELSGIISRPEWQAALSAAECRELLALMREAGTVVTPRERIAACRDPDDNALLECAVGHADVLVSGDNDLLILHPFRGLRILKPADFLQFLP